MKQPKISLTKWVARMVMEGDGIVVQRHDYKRDVSLRQLAILGQACESQTPLSITEHALRLNMHNPSASRTVDQLEKSGLVTRNRPADDRRRVDVLATDSGRAFYARAERLLLHPNEAT